MCPLPTVQKIVCFIIICVVIIHNNDCSKSNNIVELYSYELFVATLFVASKLTHSASFVPGSKFLWRETLWGRSSCYNVYSVSSFDQSSLDLSVIGTA